MQTIPNHPIVESDRELMMELYKKVNERVKKLPGSRITYVKMKIFLLPVIYLGFYLAALFWSAQPAVFYSMYILMGLTMVVIFLNIIHEAAHGNIFKKEKYNSSASAIKKAPALPAHLCIFPLSAVYAQLAFGPRFPRLLFQKPDCKKAGRDFTYRICKTNFI